MTLEELDTYLVEQDFIKIDTTINDSMKDIHRWVKRYDDPRLMSFQYEERTKTVTQSLEMQRTDTKILRTKLFYGKLVDIFKSENNSNELFGMKSAKEKNDREGVLPIQLWSLDEMTINPKEIIEDAEIIDTEEESK